LVIDYGSGLAFISVRAVPAEIRTRTTCCCFHTPRSTPVQQIVLADELTASGAFDRIRAVHEQSSNSATNPIADWDHRDVLYMLILACLGPAIR
jgi:hypothetical protein